jgi:hypothetical protein
MGTPRRAPANSPCVRSLEQSRAFATLAIVHAAGSQVGVVTGRWAGSNKVQVVLEDGTYIQVESSTSSADEISPGDRVSLSLDADGSPVDWAPYPPAN